MESLWKFAEPHYAEIVSRVWNGESDFTPAQATQLAYLLRAVLFGLQDQFLLKNQRLADPYQTASMERGLTILLSTPALRALWITTHGSYSAEFAAYVESLVSGVPLARPQDFSAQIKSKVAELKAATNG